MSKASLSCETCKHFIANEFGGQPECARTKTVQVYPARVHKEHHSVHFKTCDLERSRDFPGCGELARHWEPNWWERNHAPAKMALVCVLVTLLYFIAR
ncbi:hypothetical protein CJ97_gp21 [Ralstonia phage RSB2]|uniref:Uncharacterized protein ORF21 n=1 Tax=Ralstonia phage RSB2 TaxID=913183 RepID=E5RV01_9CAUD|nr:hypothetical protein CJ97_gp21 [Ralstonia phage RSB2]BAJ51809.1 hypothetical protein [Ralstonia phage RSB2]